jgi:hypothetical protein
MTKNSTTAPRPSNSSGSTGPSQRSTSPSVPGEAWFSASPANRACEAWKPATISAAMPRSDSIGA